MIFYCIWEWWYFFFKEFCHVSLVQLIHIISLGLYLILLLVKACFSHGRLSTHKLWVSLHITSGLHPLHLARLRWRYSSLNLIWLHLLQLAWVNLSRITHAKLALSSSGNLKIRPSLSLSRIITRVILGHGTHLLLRHAPYNLLFTYLPL